VTDFDVQPAALQELAGLLGRARHDLDRTKTHLAKMEDFKGGTGQIGWCLDGHKAAYRTLSDWLGKLADPTVSGTSTAASESASYYERTDATSAAKLDATYPDTNVIEYKEDTGYLDIEDWWDSLSVMSLAGTAIQRVSEVAVWFGWLAGQAILRNVGRAANDIRLNIHWADQVWQGNAGDGATVYLMNLGRRFDADNAWPPIDALAQQYVDASRDMVNLRDAAVGVLNSIGDYAVEAAIACGVGGGAASTGVGAPIAVGAALFVGYKIARVVDGITDLLDIVGKLATATSALKAAQDGFAGPGN
jgi:hypothetical protein